MKSIKLLVLCDDIWHPAETIRKGLAGLEDFGFQFDWIEDACEFSTDQLATYPAVILSKANQSSSTNETPWMTEIFQQAFLDYVNNGNGLLVIHSGTAEYQQASILRGLMGGVFREHPDQCPVTIEPCSGHPLAVGSETFTITDEHYFMELDDHTVDIILHTISEHGLQPGGWSRCQGDGRVSVLTPGHNLEVWQHPFYQRLLLNALHWCSQID